jgi:tryptophan synthase alpha chain
MGRISERFEALRGRKETALISFVTAGDPDLETTEALVLSLAASGVDLIELGVPFSDPIAEGPAIQRASERALAAGATLRRILELVGRVRDKVDIPLLLMGYANPIHAMGAEAFAKAANEVGVDGIIIPDLTPEDGAPYLDPIREMGIDVILLASPTTQADRLEMLSKETQGFLYYVSLQGVTGVRTSIGAGVEERVRQAQSFGDMPVCVGFGVATPAHAEAIGGYADGVVVGSAIVDAVEAAMASKPPGPRATEAAVEEVTRFIQELKKPLRR